MYIAISQAKIPCSGLCRCVGCRNLPDKPENKSLMHLADAAGTPPLIMSSTISHLYRHTDPAAGCSHFPPPGDLGPYTYHTRTTLPAWTEVALLQIAVYV